MNLPTRQFTDSQPSHVVVLLHGYGADGHDLIDLAEPLSTALPHAVFYSPHAPDETPFNGRQWFPLGRMDMDEVNQGAQQAADYLSALLDTLLQHHGLSPDKLVLGGFSQGCMMTLQVGLRRAVAPAALLGFGGLLPNAETLADEIKCRPPVFLAHGQDDSVVAAAFARQARKTLQENNVEVVLDMVQGLGHGIAPSSLQKAVRFLQQNVA